MLLNLDRICLLGLCLAFAACQTAPPASSVAFRNPEPVAVLGYSGDLMEPFLTRDGKYLFFNNRNQPQDNTNLHWAERLDDLHFRYLGELQGVNTPALEAVASMDRDGNFYFVSNRSYGLTASTLYRAKFTNGALSHIELVPGVSPAKPGIVNFDAEISADGNTLYFVESQFNRLGQPQSAHILFARRAGNVFVRDPAAESILQSVNTATLNYAPSTSASEREIFFTRLTPNGPAIFTARRSARAQLFGDPIPIAAIQGFAEAPTLSPDERTLYYHKKENGRFVLYRVTRSEPPPAR